MQNVIQLYSYQAKNSRFVTFVSNCLLLFILFLFLLGCSPSSDDKELQKKQVNDIDTELKKLISNEDTLLTHRSVSDISVSDISVSEASVSNAPSITSPIAQLGKELFFTTALSGDFDVACVSCHHPFLGGGDDLAVSIGVEAADPNLLGPGRKHLEGEFNIPRNAPTIFNIALWKKSLFWDSRVEVLPAVQAEPDQSFAHSAVLRTPESRYGSPDKNALEDMVATQGFFPITSTNEMRGDHFQFGMANDAVRLHLAARLGDYGIGKNEIKNNPWPKRFAEVFAKTNVTEEPSHKITYSDIALALSAYQKSQLFINNPWQDYLKGDDEAISIDAKKGALLFYKSESDGGAGCAACHSGPFFTDEEHYVSGSPQIGEGKNNGPDEDDDFGRARETRDLADKYKFRTPTLLNIEVTKPYFHAGSAITLADTIKQHMQPDEYAQQYFDNKRWCEVAPFSSHANCDELFPNAQQNTQYALKALSQQPNPRLSPLLADEQVKHLVAFLKTLTDPCVLDAECLQPWLLSGDEPEEMQLLEIKIRQSLK